jgi:hypothetical protein
VLVDDSPPLDLFPDGEAAAEAQAAAREAATELLALPWELLHDGRTWLFQGRNAVRVRRRLPNRVDLDDHKTGLPIRILLVSPRPDCTTTGDPVGYIDHRASARPLVEAVENLGELARLTVLHPPTYQALEHALRQGDQGQPFDVVHLDGHGVYDRKLGLGGLCFEQPQNEELSRGDRVLDFVDSVRLAGLVRDHRIPLVFLEACQTALAETDPTASVAGRLLDEGVASVVAMTHSVLVETSRRFVQAFYRGLATGARVGTAMLEGQRALYNDPHRGKILGAGELRMQDWFVPVLYQERLDPQPINRLPPATVQRLERQGRTLRLGELPEPRSTTSRAGAGNCWPWNATCTTPSGRWCAAPAARARRPSRSSWPGGWCAPTAPAAPCSSTSNTTATRTPSSTRSAANSCPITPSPNTPPSTRPGCRSTGP